MRARQQAGFHMNRTAVDHEGDRAALIPLVVGKRCIGFSQGLDDNLRIEQAPQIVTRQQHNLTTRRSNELGHKSLSFYYRGLQFFELCDTPQPLRAVAPSRETDRSRVPASTA